MSKHKKDKQRERHKKILKMKNLHISPNLVELPKTKTKTQEEKVEDMFQGQAQ